MYIFEHYSLFQDVIKHVSSSCSLHMLCSCRSRNSTLYCPKGASRLGGKRISTEVFSISVHDSEESRAAFYRLFDYIDGQNSEGMKIPMTAPVSRRIIAGEGPNCESNFTMSFFIPSDLQENPPLPLDSTVYIEERAAFKVAAKRFGGFPSSDIEFAIQAAELYELAFNEGLELTDVPLWTAGFDGPNVITNRRNEVWLEIN